MKNNSIFTDKRMKKMKLRCEFFITGWDENRKQFLFGVIKDGQAVEIGHFSEGIGSADADTLVLTIKTNAVRNEAGKFSIPPSICVLLSFDRFENEQIIGAVFESFLFKESWENCTWDRLVIKCANIENEVSITHPDKPLWSQPALNKEGFISYLIQAAPFFLPFLKDKLLTTIRFPHGYGSESFFQKNCPDYAPSFIEKKRHEGIDYILCNNLSTLVWLGNQLAMEYHIPFQTIASKQPNEIVFDLDPPDTDHFPLAIKAAVEMKKIFDDLNIISFPKLSGSKGIQVHIPIMHTSLTFNDTRRFTELIAHYIIEKYPHDFTIERLKKNRGAKLYIDYIQHAEGKTIICPYSPRGRANATVAAPLFWDEVNEGLKMENYNIPRMIERFSEKDCPMKDFFDTRNFELEGIVESLKSESGG